MDVIEAVADATDRRATALEPLYEVIDPDALNSLFGSGPRGSSGETGSVSFRYARCAVTVNADGRTTASVIDDVE